MSVVRGEHLPRDVFDRLCAGVADHLTSVGLATELPGSPYYEADGYWRGPVWAPATVLIEDGLRRGGAVELADRVSAQFRTVCEKSGFAENFDALTGEGLRDRAYTWTASAYLILAEDSERGGRHDETELRHGVHGDLQCREGGQSGSQREPDYGRESRPASPRGATPIERCGHPDRWAGCDQGAPGRRQASG
ncbi:hypothetical protein JOF56_009236 [Kibdelosporangium banguiense]|uniref:Mannosylglycerate hydrolase MGH1-like glycoside hydrolase domain-containing protein n=1 Tax=Kibdelosporangium banguiense TaxID=1365924 RepID=A0ABS4TWU1_9PSEU|nr:hypothetical protein [Kibdelosporangium banguiense]MBP2328851.1 hypothetical protein [Kibdelosporangium banguiense]